MAWRGHRPEGCLIGHCGMHFGDLSLLVAQGAVNALAPGRCDCALERQCPARAVAERLVGDGA